MKDTTFYLTEAQMPRWVIPAKREGEQLLPAEIALLYGHPPTWRDHYPASNGGLFSTAPDYTRFAQMLLSGGVLDGRRYLTAESVRMMSTVQTGDLVTGFTPGNGWGLGVCIVRQPQGVTEMLSPGTFGHGGALRYSGLDRHEEGCRINHDDPAVQFQECRRHAGQVGLPEGRAGVNRKLSRRSR